MSGESCGGVGVRGAMVVRTRGGAKREEGVAAWRIHSGLGEIAGTSEAWMGFAGTGAG